MYWASASRILAEPAGMRIDASRLQHVPGQIDGRDIEEAALLVKASLQEQAVPVEELGNTMAAAVRMGLLAAAVVKFGPNP